MDYGRAFMGAICFYIACAFFIGGFAALVLFFIVQWLWNHLPVGIV